MTFTPEQDLAKHIRFIAEYDDGTTDVFAISTWTASPIANCPPQLGQFTNHTLFLSGI